MKNQKLKQIKDALAIDPVAEAEKLGLRDDLGALLCFTQLKKDILNPLLEETKDVNSWNQNLGQYLAALESMGFVKIYDQPIPDTKDRHLMYWLADKGLLLNMDTYYDNTGVNGGNVYFNLDGGYVSGCSGATHYPDGYKEDVAGIFCGDKDCREAVRHFIETAETKGKFLKKWVRQPFLWLLNYKDSKVANYDYKAINKARIAMLPKEVQEAIDAPRG